MKNQTSSEMNQISSRRLIANLHQSLASTFIPTNSRLAIHKTHRVLQRIVERLIKKQRSKAE